jgi:hypothetical protein
MSDDPVPPTTRTDRVTPNPAGIPQADPPEGGPNADPDSPDASDLAPGFGGDSESRPKSTNES